MSVSLSRPIWVLRFCLLSDDADLPQYINAMRLFQTQPKWAALNRNEETELNQFRKNYVQARAQRFQE